MERVILFAKAPRLHAVKTRLRPAFTAEQAVAFHEAMLFDQLAFLSSLRGADRACEVCLDEPVADGSPLGQMIARFDRALQGAGDLGDRMRHALDRAFAAGISRAIIVGGDAPTLPRALVEQAFGKLRTGADVAITPAEDGGYVAIGAWRSVPRIFEDVPWGTAKVLDVTRQRAREAGYLIGETESWTDVDSAVHLGALVKQIASNPGRAPGTAAFLMRLGLYAPQKPVV